MKKLGIFCLNIFCAISVFGQGATYGPTSQNQFQPIGTTSGGQTIIAGANITTSTNGNSVTINGASGGATNGIAQSGGNGTNTTITNLTINGTIAGTAIVPLANGGLGNGTGNAVSLTNIQATNVTIGTASGYVRSFHSGSQLTTWTFDDPPLLGADAVLGFASSNYMGSGPGITLYSQGTNGLNPWSLKFGGGGLPAFDFAVLSNGQTNHVFDQFATAFICPPFQAPVGDLPGYAQLVQDGESIGGYTQTKSDGNYPYYIGDPFQQTLRFSLWQVGASAWVPYLGNPATNVTAYIDAFRMEMVTGIFRVYSNIFSGGSIFSSNNIVATNNIVAEGQFVGSGAGLTSLGGGNFASTFQAFSVFGNQTSTAGAQPNSIQSPVVISLATTNSSGGGLGTSMVSGNVTSYGGVFTGNGSGLTNIPIGAIQSTNAISSGNNTNYTVTYGTTWINFINNPITNVCFNLFTGTNVGSSTFVVGQGSVNITNLFPTNFYGNIVGPTNLFTTIGTNFAYIKTNNSVATFQFITSTNVVNNVSFTNQSLYITDTGLSQNFNGNFTGVFTGNGNALTNVGTIIRTNWVSGQVYVNPYPSTIRVSGSATLAVAGVAGNAIMSLEGTVAVGSDTNQFGISTLLTSIAMNYTNYLALDVPPGGSWTWTNRSTGAGNSAGVVRGQLRIN